METKMTLYHGSNVEFSAVDLAKSKDKRDFGKGFYLTTLKSQAESWAIRMYNRYGFEDSYVYEFELTITDDLRMKQFSGLTEEWLKFIAENRIKGGIQHNFDLVQGPVANDDTRETISYYIDGIYRVEEALRRLEYKLPNDQISIHTEKALSQLILTRKEIYVK
ncbi:hypothetical protein AGMMS50293_27410 [Spirochaetia bacterium]|nr:hypothetical protein AGMMS50293_27410 [Spirochaetia bacterium]